jgi:hypothetical protein
MAGTRITTPLAFLYPTKAWSSPCPRVFKKLTFAFLQLQLEGTLASSTGQRLLTTSEQATPLRPLAASAVIRHTFPPLMIRHSLQLYHSNTQRERHQRLCRTLKPPCRLLSLQLTCALSLRSFLVPFTNATPCQLHLQHVLKQNMMQRVQQVGRHRNTIQFTSSPLIQHRGRLHESWRAAHWHA